MELMIGAGVPVYNTPPAYLDALLSSIVSQTYSRFNVCVLDDHSDVDYSEVLNKYSSDSRIQYCRNAKNLGIVGAWNESVRRAEGELNIVLGHDDIILPGLFQAYVSAFDASKDTVLVSCAEEFINGDGARITFRPNVNDRSNIFRSCLQYVLDGREVTRLSLRNGAALGEGHALMFRRLAFEEIGGYDPDFCQMPCVDFAIRITRLGNACYINQRLLLRRLHGGNLTNANWKSGRQTTERQMIFDRHAGMYDFADSDVERARAFLVACACNDLVRQLSKPSGALRREAVRQLREQVRLQPAIYASLVFQILTHRNMDRK